MPIKLFTYNLICYFISILISRHPMDPSHVMIQRPNHVLFPASLYVERFKNTGQILQSVEIGRRSFYKIFWEAQRSIKILHESVHFCDLHKFFKLHELYFLFLKECIDIYRSENQIQSDEEELLGLYEKVRFAYAAENNVFTKNKTLATNELKKIINILKKDPIFKEIDKVLERFQNVLSQGRMGDLELQAFYDPKLIVTDWKDPILRLNAHDPYPEIAAPWLPASRATLRYFHIEAMFALCERLKQLVAMQPDERLMEEKPNTETTKVPEDTALKIDAILTGFSTYRERVKTKYIPLFSRFSGNVPRDDSEEEELVNHLDRFCSEQRECFPGYDANTAAGAPRFFAQWKLFYHYCDIYHFSLANSLHLIHKCLVEKKTHLNILGLDNREPFAPIKELETAKPPSFDKEIDKLRAIESTLNSLPTKEMDSKMQDKFRQMGVQARLLREALEILQKVKQYDSYFLWANHSIRVSQNLISEMYTVSVFKKTGIWDINHDIAHLCEQLGWEADKEFHSLNIKTRYPVEIEGGEIVDELEKIRLYPEYEKNFNNVKINVADPWKFDKEKVSFAKVDKKFSSFISLVVKTAEQYLNQH